MEYEKAGNEQIIPGMTTGALASILSGGAMAPMVLAGGAAAWTHAAADQLLNGDCPCGI